MAASAKTVRGRSLLAPDWSGTELRRLLIGRAGPDRTGRARPGARSEGTKLKNKMAGTETGDVYL